MQLSAGPPDATYTHALRCAYTIYIVPEGTKAHPGLRVRFCFMQAGAARLQRSELPHSHCFLRSTSLLQKKGNEIKHQFTLYKPFLLTFDCKYYKVNYEGLYPLREKRALREEK